MLPNFHSDLEKHDDLKKDLHSAWLKHANRLQKRNIHIHAVNLPSFLRRHDNGLNAIDLSVAYLIKRVDVVSLLYSIDYPNLKSKNYTDDFDKVQHDRPHNFTQYATHQ